MIALSTFAELHQGRSREDFLAVVCVPHLLLEVLPAPPEAMQEGGFRTTPYSPLLLQLEGSPVLFPLEKRDSNAFSLMITLGRAGNNDVVLSHTGISKFHAYFRSQDDRWTISDANSTYGTFLDGVRLPAEEPRPLHAGARVGLAGGLELLFLPPEALYERAVALAGS